jgi:hypothetical protein
MLQTKIYHLPAQKKTMAEKTDTWGKENIEAGLTITTSETGLVRKRKSDLVVNYNLIAGIIDEAEIEKVFNPMNIKGVHFPAKIQNYPIELSKFNVLKGEEGKRRFDFRLRTVNEDAISAKEYAMGMQLRDLIFSEISNSDYSEEQAAKRMEQLKHYQEYEYQDASEKMGSRILSYFWHTQQLKHVFSSSFFDVLVAAEEIFAVDAIHGEPVITRKNPLNIYTMGMGESHKIEDADLIVEDGFRSVGSVIDEFWDVLSSDEVTQLEEKSRFGKHPADIVLIGPIDSAQESTLHSNSQLITVDGKTARGFGSFYNEDGDIRVSRVVWKSRKKVGKLQYIDKNGDERETFVDENFPIREDLGWKIEWFWINEWWQGYKIGPDIYVRMEPLPRIGSTMNNPSRCLPPYVGTVYSMNTSEGISLMDRVKPYKYLYNVYMRRTELASARNKGVIAELDLAEIPDGWDEELVMMYAEANGYMIKDSFKEGKKGAATGRLVGTVKQRKSEAINLSSEGVIKANLELALYVKNELSEVAGISPQREGQISNRETAHGVERSVVQSSHITEEWFMLHDNTKIRVLMLILETAKRCWGDAKNGGVKKLQYVDDGLISHIVTIDRKMLAEAEYGLYVSDSSNDAALIQAIKQFAHAALQNDKAKLSDVLNIYRDTSVSSMAKKLESSEKDRDQREDTARREALESQERSQQALMQFEKMKIDQTYAIEMSEIQKDLTVKQMEIDAEILKAQGSDNGQLEKNRADLEKLRLQLDERRKEFEEKSRQFNAKLKQDKDINKLNISSQEKIARQRKVATKA